MNSNHKMPLNFVSSSSPHDEYELIQRIGSGTYGDVYKARHIPTATMRALKVIKFEANDDFEIIQQEIVMMIQCNHPNIISYFGSYLKRDKLWIAMELCSGGSMQDIYHAYGPLNELQIAYILKETLQGLDYLHKNGKMHRDIKGANILLTDEGHVKLADFGIAASLTATMCKRKSFIGTPYWMAPEVAAVERKGGYNHLCDIWAVGITAIEFAELQPPMFDLHPMRALFIMSKSGFKPPTLKDKAKWSLTFHNFIKYALIKNPKKRPSAERLLEHPFVQGNLTSHIAKDLLDRLHNGATSTISSDERDDDDDDRNHYQAPRRITSSSNDRPLVKNLNQPPIIRSSILDSSNHNQSSQILTNNENTEHIERLKAIGVTDDDIKCLMAKLPLSAFRSLTYDEIQHIVDVMREADVEDNEDNEDSTNGNTIKRTPYSNLDENILDGNNNHTLKQTTHLPSISDENDSKQDSFSHGIPSVPRVHMGAGFMKIFNQCPLNIYASYCWTNSENKDQYVLIAAEEGVYSLNLNELHDTTLELLYPRRTTWLFVNDNILWSISGKSNSLYRHDLFLLIQNKTTARLSLQLNKMQIQQKFEKLIPKKSTASIKIPNTRGCIRCCVGRNQFNGFIYLAGQLSDQIFLMQYYDPLKKFMHLKTVSLSIPIESRLFQMIFSPENPYAYICIGVSKHQLKLNSYKFAVVNFESEKIENFYDLDQIMNISQIIQNEKDADMIFICRGNNISIVNVHGKSIANRKISELFFTYDIESLVCLQDSILAFHKHGMQGRNLNDNEITQEIYDQTRIFRVIGNDRLVVLQSRSFQAANTFNDTLSDLHILMGHENT